MTLPAVRLTCRAPHPDPAKRGEPCGYPLADLAPGSYEFVTIAERMPPEADGLVRARCHRPRCEKWNVWRPAPVIAVAPLPPLQERIAALPEEQQKAVVALAGGLNNTATARAIGVTRQTIVRWAKDANFAAIRRAIAPELTSEHVRTAIEGFFTVLEKDRKKGVAHNFRWFLARTVFRDFEQQRAAAGGTNVSLTMTQMQAQQQTQAAVDRVWEERRNGRNGTGLARSE